MLSVNTDDQVWQSRVGGFRKSVTTPAVLRRMKKRLSFEIRRDLYLSLVVPRFNYCSETWHFCSKVATDKLGKINERDIGFVLKDKHTSTLKVARRTYLCARWLCQVFESRFSAGMINRFPLWFLASLIKNDWTLKKRYLLSCRYKIVWDIGIYLKPHFYKKC